MSDQWCLYVISEWLSKGINGQTIKIQVFCWVLISRHIRGCVKKRRVIRRPREHWMRHSGMHQNLWEGHTKLLFWLSKPKLIEAKWQKVYLSLFIVFSEVDDMTEGRNNIDVDASEWFKSYPSELMVFWKDMISTN